MKTKSNTMESCDNMYHHDMRVVTMSMVKYMSLDNRPNAKL